eukprot:jgi/Orpsp1_1/1176165/evm.model.c7180000056625.1
MIWTISALHYAIEIENPKLVQMIMKKNQKKDLININNKTAKMLANEINNKEVLQILNNLSGSVKLNTSNNDVFDKHYTEIQLYVTPFFNNNYPDYKCTKEMEKIKNEIYFRFVGTNFKKIIINNLILI